MTSRRGLKLITRNDLPPCWDGEPVHWYGWSSHDRTTMLLHAPPETMACDKCGAIDENRLNWGSRPPPQGVETIFTPKMTRSGHQYSVEEERQPPRVRDLLAARCRHCGHDTVTDHRTGEHWDLDDDDYSDTGSTPPDTLF